MGRMADAEKLSIPQLQQAIKNGTIPAYVGVPMLQDKVKQRQQAMAMQQAQQAQQGQDQVPLAAQVMQDADQYRGIDELPTNLPTAEDDQTVDDEYANGGIIAFADEGQVRDPNPDVLERMRQDDPEAFGRLMRSVPTDKLTEAQFDMLPKDQQEIRERDYEGDRFTGGISKYLGTALSAIPMTAGAAAMTPVSIAAQYGTEVLNTKPMQYLLRKAGIMEPGQTEIKNKIPTVQDMLGKKGIAGIPNQAISHLNNSNFAPTLRETLQARDGRGETIGPQGLNPIPLAEPETIGPQGLTALPRAKNVQIAPEQRDASTTAPTSGTGTAAPAGGEKLTPKVGLENAPPTLAQAEAVAGKSPAAAQALSATDRYIEMLEKSGQDVGREKKEALYMALIKGGLAAAGGTSPNALANIAAGMVPAAEGYSKDIAGIRKDERARLEKLIAAGVSKEKIGLEAKKLGITEKHFDQMYNAKMAQLGVMGGQRADARAQAEDMKRLTVAKGIFDTLKKDQLTSGASDEDLWTKAQVMAGQIEAPAAPKNKFPGFSLVTPKK
jgi:hypothetical protein